MRARRPGVRATTTAARNVACTAPFGGPLRGPIRRIVVRSVLVEAGPALAAELTRGDHVDRAVAAGAWSSLPLAAWSFSPIATETSRPTKSSSCSGPHRLSGALGHAGVDLDRFESELVEEPDRVEQVREQQPVDDEAGFVGDLDDVLAQRPAEGAGAGADVVVQRPGQAELDELHPRHRIEDVEAVEAVGDPGPLSRARRCPSEEVVVARSASGQISPSAASIAAFASESSTIASTIRSQPSRSLGLVVTRTRSRRRPRSCSQSFSTFSSARQAELSERARTRTVPERRGGGGDTEGDRAAAGDGRGLVPVLVHLGHARGSSAGGSAAAGGRRLRLLRQRRRPPGPAVEVERERGNEDRPDDERVEQDAEGDHEAELGEEDERQYRERREGAGEDDPGRGDDGARHRQAAQHPLARTAALGLLANPGHQEDVVVDSQRDQEYEREEG